VRRFNDGHRAMILLHDHLDALLDLRQHGMYIAREFGFCNMDRHPTLIIAVIGSRPLPEARLANMRPVIRVAVRRTSADECSIFQRVPLWEHRAPVQHLFRGGVSPSLPARSAVFNPSRAKHAQPDLKTELSSVVVCTLFCGKMNAYGMILSLNPSFMRCFLTWLPASLTLLAGGASAQYAYISATNGVSSEISVINTFTNAPTATVVLGGITDNNSAVAVSPSGRFVYVAASQGTLSVIDTTTNGVTATINVGADPIGVAVHPAGTFVYVANYVGNTISVINAATNTVAATVPVGVEPRGVTVNPAGTYVYVANGSDGTVSVIDTATNRVTATVTRPKSNSGRLPSCMMRK